MLLVKLSNTIFIFTPVIYTLLKFLTRLTIHGYFRKVTITGKHHIPKSGPYIFVANHPSAFMDPIVVGTSVSPPVYFIAAGEYIGTGLKAWIFKRLLHMIPVYRPSTRPEDAHKNKDMFKTCYTHLINKGALLIFPEGVSLTEKKLKPLKTGTIRIVIGAEREANFNLKVPIIPIGLNYSNPHEFRSDLYVKIGKPIYVEGVGPETTTEEEIEITKSTTLELHEAMRKTVLHLESEEDEELFEKLISIYSREIKAQFEIQFSDQVSEFFMQKDIIEAISYFRESSPILYDKTADKVDQYLQKLEQNKLQDKDIAELEKRKDYKRVGSFIIGSPTFLFGLIHNYIPYKLAGVFSSKIKVNENFSGSITLAIGLVLFSIWYTGLTIPAIYYLGWSALIYPILIYITGLYALLYNTAIQHSRQRNYLRKFYQTNQSVCEELVKDRQEIIDVLTVCQKDFIENQKEAKSSLHQ